LIRNDLLELPVLVLERLQPLGLEFFRGVEGIRVANFIGADFGQVNVVMSGNRSYENVLGCILENNRSRFATIHVLSSGDRFEDNGCDLPPGS
jgi:hypothetical protein